MQWSKCVTFTLCLAWVQKVTSDIFTRWIMWYTTIPSCTSLWARLDYQPGNMTHNPPAWLYVNGLYIIWLISNKSHWCRISPDISFVWHLVDWFKSGILSQSLVLRTKLFSFIWTYIKSNKRWRLSNCSIVFVSGKYRTENLIKVLLFHYKRKPATNNYCYNQLAWQWLALVIHCLVKVMSGE